MSGQGQLDDLGRSIVAELITFTTRFEHYANHQDVAPPLNQCDRVRGIFSDWQVGDAADALSGMKSVNEMLPDPG